MLGYRSRSRSKVKKGKCRKEKTNKKGERGMRNKA
jgi:hypothetical protein